MHEPTRYDFSGVHRRRRHRRSGPHDTADGRQRLTLTLSSNLGIENVDRHLFADTLLGNGQDNVLIGASLPDDRLTAGPGLGRGDAVGVPRLRHRRPATANTSTPRPSATPSRLASTDDYHGPDPPNPWFHVIFTQTLTDIPAALRNAGQFVTEFFNRTPSFNRPGGEASDLDFGNTDLGGTTSIQVNGLTGGADQPATTSDNIVALASKIGAHELAHLMGVRHADAFGPIGYGVHSLRAATSSSRTFGGPDSAFETFDHLIGSPATVGSDRFNDLGDLYFGAREAVKLEPSPSAAPSSPSSRTPRHARHRPAAESRHAGGAEHDAERRLRGFDARRRGPGRHRPHQPGQRPQRERLLLVHGPQGRSVQRRGAVDRPGTHAAGAPSTRCCASTTPTASSCRTSAGWRSMTTSSSRPTRSAARRALPADGTYYVEVDTFAPRPDRSGLRSDDPDGP